jgi:glutathione-regulated potassium-efflux system ancillary protein KefF
MPDTPTILVLFAHLAIQRSRINRAMIEAIRGLPQVILRDLLELYSDFYIDVDAEQELVRQADLIVFHHPIYWYGTPAILKHWQDVVLTRGFAYGPGGDALKGKDFMLAISTGGSADAYRPGGAHGRPLPELLRPLEQMAVFCGMRFLPPFVIQGGHGLTAEVIAAHARQYCALLDSYRPTAAGAG